MSTNTTVDIRTECALVNVSIKQTRGHLERNGRKRSLGHFISILFYFIDPPNLHFEARGQFVSILVQWKSQNKSILIWRKNKLEVMEGTWKERVYERWNIFGKRCSSLFRIVCETGWVIGWRMLAERTESFNDKTLNLQRLIWIR